MLPTQLFARLSRVPGDAALAVAVGLIVAVGSLVQESSWAGVIAGALLGVPLAWRRRWPLGTCAVLAAGILAYLALAEPSPVFMPAVVVALYTVAAHGSRRRTVALALALVPYAWLIVALFSPEDGSRLRQLLELVSQSGIALAIGEAVRSQRAYVTAVRERAEHARHEHALEARRRVDDERMRIARDVHDVVAHSLATISTQASVGVHVGRDQPARAVEALESIKAVSAQALNDLRHALGVLRDASGDDPVGPTPSVGDVPGLVQRARDSGLAVELRMEGVPSGLPTALQVAIYRIVQEGLTNVMRHAGGARATVRVAVREREIEVDVSDDGDGASTAPTATGSGSGLVGMRQRASAMGGELEAGEHAGGGFRVRAVMPLDRAPA